LINPFLIRHPSVKYNPMSDFQVRLAETPQEVESAQRLRFEVFNIEMKRGLRSSYASGIDADGYDALCDHILIIDKAKNMTVGTYRFLLRSRLDDGGRFYSENEFDLSNIKKLEGEILEMGRSCVHRDYRRQAILQLLWGGIVRYLTDHDVSYIIGCPSIYTMEPREVGEIYALFKKSYFAPEHFRVFPRKSGALEGLREEEPIDGREKKIFLSLPSLIKSYLKVGAVVCGAPAVDREFSTVDFFMLLDVSKMSGAYLDRLRVGKS